MKDVLELSINLKKIWIIFSMDQKIPFSMKMKLSSEVFLFLFLLRIVWEKIFLYQWTIVNVCMEFCMSSIRPMCFTMRITQWNIIRMNIIQYNNQMYFFIRTIHRTWTNRWNTKENRHVFLQIRKQTLSVFLTIYFIIINELIPSNGSWSIG